MTPKLPLFIEPVSLDMAFRDPRRNLRLMEGALRERLKASPVPSERRLILFPELSLTGFATRNPPAYRLDPPHPYIRALARMAKSHGTALAAGFPEKAPGSAKPFNALALFGPDGEVLGAYRKLHLFTAGAAPESGSYRAGERGRLVDYRGWRIGLSICFDLRFPRLFQEYAEAGADLILMAACWVGGPHKSRQFRLLNAAQAVLSQAYVAAVNRSGKDPAYAYDGAELVFSPFGESLYRGRPCRLDAADLEASRRLVFRPSARPRYPIQTAD